MCPQTTLCAMFKDLLFSGTPYYNVLIDELFWFLDARWLCQVGRNMLSEAEKSWDRAVYYTIYCSGGIIEK